MDNPNGRSEHKNTTPAIQDDGGGDRRREHDRPAQRSASATSTYDRLLRKTAEFDNYRKRIERERREQSDEAVATPRRTCCRSSTISIARSPPRPAARPTRPIGRASS